MKITMKSIAERLGVSRTTVSLVLQGKGDAVRISRSTQQRITAVARELDFRPNYLATALNKGVTGTIGVVFPDMFEDFMGAMIRGIEDVLYAAGSLLLFSTCRFDNHRESEVVGQLLYRGVDGIVIAAAAPFRGVRFDYSHVRQAAAEGVPLVMLDRYVPGIEACRVVQDDEGWAFQAVERLCRQGMRRIACLSFDLDITSLQDRITGWRRAKAACCSAEEDAKSPLLLLKSQDRESGDLIALVDGMLARKGLPEAFFVTTGGIAERLADLLDQRGVVPGVDIVICRFSSEPGSRQPAGSFPPGGAEAAGCGEAGDSGGYPPDIRADIIPGSRFIEVRQPNYELGCMAARELLSLIRTGAPNRLKTVTVGGGRPAEIA